VGQAKQSWEFEKKRVLGTLIKLFTKLELKRGNCKKLCPPRGQPAFTFSVNDKKNAGKNDPEGRE